VLRLVSSRPVTFDRLQNTRLNVASLPTLGAILSSQEDRFEHTDYDSQEALKGPVLVVVKEARNHGGEMCESGLF